MHPDMSARPTRNAAILPPAQDIAHRLPIWIALAELYLDADLAPDDLPILAEKLAASRYTEGELAHILLSELHPVLVTNLMQVAGVWNGFDADWLQARVLARTRARLRWPARLLPLRRATLARAVPLFDRVKELRQAR
jgi:hypothetical protein